MTPKEALDELCDLATPNGDCLNYVIGLSGIILKALDRLEGINKVWHENEPMESVDINGNHLQEKYDLLNDLYNHLDTFILAFNSLWRCCNSKDVLTDLDEENSTYLEFRCGFENVCVPVTEAEISAIKKACDFLNITVSEVLE